MTPALAHLFRRSDLPAALPRRRDPAALASDLLPLADALCLLAATALAARWGLPAGLRAGFADELASAAWFAAVLAPFMLYDPWFGTTAGRGQVAAALGAHALRFGAFAATLCWLGAFSDVTGSLTRSGLVGGLGVALLSTTLTRALAAAALGRLQQRLAATATAAARGEPAATGGARDWIVLAERPIGRRDAVTKTAEDLLLGSLVTLLLLPLLGLIAVAIRLDGPGPILYRQRRHALNNDEFDIFKFRTMRWDPCGSDAAIVQTERGDPRVTRVGRFLRAWSLDELPQLFNVLQGTMSLVGPRPHATQMRTENRLGSEITVEYAHRHRVKPGITGWAQVNGARGATDTAAQLQRRIDLDLHYIAHWSLWLDLKILALTTRAVLRRTNAF